MVSEEEENFHNDMKELEYFLSVLEKDTKPLEIGNISEDDDDSVKTITENDWISIENEICDLIEEYLIKEIKNIHEPNFHETMKFEIISYYFETIIEANCSDDQREQIEQKINQLCDEFFEGEIPPRSSIENRPCCITLREKNTIQQKLNILKNIKQPAQRTPEWYALRHETITASNAWKIFGTEYQKTSLIHEKCKSPILEKEPPPPLLSSSDCEKQESEDAYCPNFVNVNSSLHWGVKFEPLTVMIYENMFNTKLAMFGLIQHPQYKFLGASPDGINDDEHNLYLYGRMVEIKNIVNREINGIPKKEYWIQMQLQMEVCNLNECDFVETRFKLYGTKNDFFLDRERKYKGVILYFIEKIIDFNHCTNQPYYVYMPLDISTEEQYVNEWIEKTKGEHQEKYSLFEEHFWYLDEISVVLVKRNTEWFFHAKKEIENTWNKIEQEKEKHKYHTNHMVDVPIKKKKEGICLITKLES